jgi:hypothetical protein
MLTAVTARAVGANSSVALTRSNNIEEFDYMSATAGKPKSLSSTDSPVALTHMRALVTGSLIQQVKSKLQ